MFKHILIPTDGSQASERAILAGVALARDTGATLVGLTVVPPFHVLTTSVDMLETTAEQYEQMAHQRAQSLLSDFEQAAKEANVPCRVMQVVGDSPYETIISTARDQGCDLILMASHGHKGLKGLLLGSETQKVLVHSAIPVLVYR